MAKTKKGRRWILCCRIDDVTDSSDSLDSPVEFGGRTKAKRPNIWARIRKYFRDRFPTKVQVRIRKPGFRRPGDPNSFRVLFQFSPCGGDFRDTIIGLPEFPDFVENWNEEGEDRPVTEVRTDIKKDALSSADVQLYDESLPEIHYKTYRVSKRYFEEDTSDEDSEMLSLIPQPKKKYNVNKGDKPEQVNKNDEGDQINKGDKPEQVNKNDERDEIEEVNKNDLHDRYAIKKVKENEAVETHVASNLSEPVCEAVNLQDDKKMLNELTPTPVIEKQSELPHQNPEIEPKQDKSISEPHCREDSHNTNAYNEEESKKKEAERRVTFNEESITQCSLLNLKKEANTGEITRCPKKSVKRKSSKKRTTDNTKREKPRKKGKPPKNSSTDASQPSGQLQALDNGNDAPLDSQGKVMTGEHGNTDLKLQHRRSSKLKLKSRQENSLSPGRRICTDRNVDLNETPWSSDDKLPDIGQRKSRRDDFAGGKEKGKIRSRHRKSETNNDRKSDKLSHSSQSREVTHNGKMVKSPTNIELDMSHCSETEHLKSVDSAKYQSDVPVIPVEGCKERQKRLLKKIYDEVNVKLKPTMSPTHTERRTSVSRETHDGNKADVHISDRKRDTSTHHSVVLPKPGGKTNDRQCLRDKETDLRLIKSSERWNDRRSADALVGHKPASEPILGTECHKKKPKKKHRKKTEDLMPKEADKAVARDKRDKARTHVEYPHRLTPNIIQKSSVDRLVPIKNKYYTGIQCTVRVKDSPPPNAKLWTNIAQNNKTDNFIPVEIVTDIKDRKTFPAKKAAW